MRRTELLLQVIADELYMARCDREVEGSTSSNWANSGGREQWKERIEQLHESLEKLSNL